MTEIHKIAEITGLSIRTLRRVEKHGFLKVTPSASPLVDAIRANLKKGNRLTVLQQLYLLQTPEARDMLTQWQFEIDQTLGALGDALNEGAPWTVASAIDLAARKDANAIGKVAGWLSSFIACDPGFDAGALRDHAYLGVRLLANAPLHQTEFLAGKLGACMWQCRNHEAMAGSWRVVDGRTMYFRPVKIPLDL